jgi:nitroreductase
MKFNKEDNDVLDKIIFNRRTVREFNSDPIPKEFIENIIIAGFLAPYGGATGNNLNESRRFFVLERSTESYKIAKELILSNIKKNAKNFEIASIFLPSLRKKGKTFLERLKTISENGIPGIETAQYYVIIAEKKGMPPVEKQSMAHALENMWLKATAYGFGFQLLSATSLMSKNKDFMDLLRLPIGEFALDGCLIGYPKNNSSKRAEFDLKDIQWLK